MLKNRFISKKKTMVILLGIILAIFGVLRQTSAASIFDNNYQLADELLVFKENYPECATHNLSASWAGKFREQAGDEAYAELITAFNGGSWAVGTYKIPIGADAGNQSAYIMYTTANDAEVTFQGVNVQYGFQNTAQGTIKIVQLTERKTSADPCGLTYSGPIEQNAAVISTIPQGNGGVIAESLVVGGDYTVDYPNDYAGEEIREVYVPPNTYYPHINYDVVNLNFQAQYTGNVPYDNTKLVDMQYRVVGQNAQGQYNQVLHDVKIGEYDIFEYIFSDYGDYEIWVDYIINPPGQLPPPDRVETLVQRLKIDGKNYSGSTQESNCNGGVCEQPTTYEDCGSYGTNVVGGFGCVMRNFQTWLRNVLISLFVPSSAFTQQYFNDLNNFFQQKLGMLVYPITYLVDMLNTMISNAGTASCLFNPGGTFWGEPINIDVCTVENSMPTVWAAFSSMVRALTIVAIIVALYRKFHDVVRGGQQA